MALFPTQATKTIAGHTFTDLTNLITLVCTTTAAGRRATFRRAGNASSGYTPSGAKKFRMLAYTIRNMSTTATVTGIAQTDNDIGTAAATAFTNPIFVGSQSNASTDFPGAVGGYGVETAGLAEFLLANGKYLSAEGATIPLTFHVYGYEES